MAQRFSGLCGTWKRPTTKCAEGGAERQDSVTNGLSHLSNDVGRLGNEQEAKRKEVHHAAAMTAVAFDTKARATFEGQSCDRIAKINGLTKATALLVKGMMIVVLLKKVEGRNERGFDGVQEGRVGSKDPSPGSHESQA